MLVAPAFAQPGIDELRQASGELKGAYYAAFDLSLVLAGILGICGAVNIYHNWQMGTDRINAAVAAWFFSALFMLLSGLFLRALFGL